MCHLQGQILTPGPKVVKLFPCSAQLRLKFILLINDKVHLNIYKQNEIQALVIQTRKFYLFGLIMPPTSKKFPNFEEVEGAY